LLCISNYLGKRLGPKSTPVAHLTLLLPNFALGLKKYSNRHHIVDITVGIQKQEEMIGASKDMEKSPSSLQSHRTGIWIYRRATYRGKTSLRKLA
jgi:hypothetical protein